MKIEKVKKLDYNLHDKTEYPFNIKNLKQTLNHASFFKKICRMIRFNQNASLKPYIEMNTDLR